MGKPTIYGTSASHFSRKVISVFEEKGIEYDLNPGGPPTLGEEFHANSPLGKIPAVKFCEGWLPDSSIISAYAERLLPEPALYPADPYEYARALWFEEYADTKIATATGKKYFAEKILAPYLFRREPIQEDIDLAVNETLPEVFTYLTRQLEGKKYLAGDQFSIADISVASMLNTLLLCEFQLDTEKWPGLAEYWNRINERPSIAKAHQTAADEVELLKKGEHPIQIEMLAAASAS